MKESEITTAATTRKAFIQLHLSVILAGFTGLFGKLITLNEVDIVWYRMFFTTLILIVFTGLPRVGWKKFFQIAGCGALLGLHWMLFYCSIKASNVSIGVFCPRRLLHRHLRTDNIQEEDFVDRATALTHHRSRTTLHLLVRLPLSLRYHHWRGIVSCMCALRHIQQEGERRCKVAHYAHVPNEWRHCGREHHHSFLPDDFPFQSARSGNS